MRIDILTLFPGMFEGFLSESIIKRAIADKKVEIEIVNFRDYSKLSNKQVDDTPYGGGSGMVLRCEPIYDCLEAVIQNPSIILEKSNNCSAWFNKNFQEENHINKLLKSKY